MRAVPGELARLAYEASLRRLDKQEQSLSEIRARTGLILAASSLGASFLGRPALDAEPVLLVLLALIAWEANDAAMQRLFLWFRLATGALAAEIAILLAALTGSLGA